MSDFTPEQMLELAHAAIREAGEIFSPVIINGKVRVYDRLLDNWTDFDPLSNPAHAWAVEQWLFSQPLRVFKNNLGGYVGYIIEWTNSSGGIIDGTHHVNNVSAALAVLERVKGA